MMNGSKQIYSEYDALVCMNGLWEDEMDYPNALLAFGTILSIGICLTLNATTELISCSSGSMYVLNVI